MKINTIFFGSSTFSLPFLQLLSQITHVKLVVSSEDKPKDRGKKIVSNYVKSFAMDMGLTVDAPAVIREKSWIDQVRAYEPDLIVTASYGKILPPELLAIPTIGCVNIHPSLLPQYRGADPIFWQLYHGCQSSGVTIFSMNKELDQGDILLTEEVVIEEHDNYESLETKMIKAGLELLKKLIDIIDNHGKINARPQANGKYFYARKITEAEEKIHWDQTRKDIINQVRALSPRIGAYTLFKGKRVKIFDVKTIQTQEKSNPGNIIVQKNKILVAAKDGLLKIDQLKPEGKNVMSAQDFINGHLTRPESYTFTE